MNKKIIIALVAVITVSVGAFVGVNAYKNSKQEVPQKTVEIADNKVLEDDKEKAATEEQKKDTEVVLDAEKAQVTFNNLLNTLTDIDYNDEAQVKKQAEVIKDTTHPALTNVILDTYVKEGKKDLPKLKLESINVDEIKQIAYKLKDKEYSALEIIYSYTLNIDGKSTEIKDRSSVVVVEDNKYKVMEIDVPIKK